MDPVEDPVPAATTSDNEEEAVIASDPPSESEPAPTNDDQFEVLGDDSEAPREVPEAVSEPVPVFGTSEVTNGMGDLSMENETIRAWREKQESLLREKDAEEERKREEMREQAKKELKDWYAKYEDALSKTKDGNRQDEKTFVSEMNEIAPGTEWERVHKLCEFGQKAAKDAKDTSRMKSILLQLKQNPKPVLQQN